MAHVGSGERRVLLWDPYLEPDDSAMQFRLTYDGLLLAHRDDDRKFRGGAQHKHDIRKVFHAQLRNLWSSNPVLRRRIGAEEGSCYGYSNPEFIANNYKRDGFRFVPLVTERNKLICKVEILMLRPGNPGGLLRNSDIDNRLKTLFDALRMTKSGLELGRATPEQDEDPFYVLLEDDSLITHVAVETDTMLQSVSGSPHDVRLVISVTVRPYDLSLFGSSEYL